MPLLKHLATLLFPVVLLSFDLLHELKYLQMVLSAQLLEFHLGGRVQTILPNLFCSLHFGLIFQIWVRLD